MTTFTKNQITNEVEVEVLGTRAKATMKKALIKAFGKERGEYLADYGMINTFNNRVYISLNIVDAKALRSVL